MTDVMTDVKNSEKETGKEIAKEIAKELTKEINTETKKRKKHIGQDEFIRTYQTSDSAKDVAAKLGVTVGSIYTRAKSYRRLGIPLKTMVRTSSKGVDVKAATALIDSLNRENLKREKSTC